MKKWLVTTSLCVALTNAATPINPAYAFELPGIGSLFKQQETQQEIFFRAVKEGDTEKVKSMVQEGFDVNTVGMDGKSALHVAAEQNQQEMCQILLDAKIDPSIADHAGKTAAEVASEAGYNDITTLINERVAQYAAMTPEQLAALQPAFGPVAPVAAASGALSGTTVAAAAGVAAAGGVAAAAAGGGGGSGGSAGDGSGGGSNPTTPPAILYGPEMFQPVDGSLLANGGDPDYYYNAGEYRNSMAPVFLDAEFAYARGYTGKIIDRSDPDNPTVTDERVLVAVIDGGFDLDHPEFDGQILPDSGRNYLENTGNVAYDDTLFDDEGNLVDIHGTHVAGIIAAKFDGVDDGMHGVAYDAQIVPIKLLDVGSTYLTVEQIRDAFTYAITGYDSITNQQVHDGAKIVNNSWGIPLTPTEVNNNIAIWGSLEPYWSQGMTDVIRNNDVAMVFAAGNDSENNPSFEAMLPYYLSGADALIKDQWVSVVNVDTTNPIDYVAEYGDSGFDVAASSNYCGLSKTWCIGAPGEWIDSTIPDDSYRPESGTSMAAPAVSGALAVIHGAFPFLSMEQVIDLTFLTADQSWFPQYSFDTPVTFTLPDGSSYTVYVSDEVGYGMVNLDAATDPFGYLSVVTGTSTAGASLASTRVSLSAAFGDALSASDATVGFKDSFNRLYQMPLASTALQPSAGLDLEEVSAEFGQTMLEKISFDDGSSFAFSAAKQSGAVSPTISPEQVEGDVVRMQYMQQMGRDTLGFSSQVPMNQAFQYGALSETDRDYTLSQYSMSNPYLGFVEEGIAGFYGYQLSDQWSFRSSFFSGSSNVAFHKENSVEDSGHIRGGVSELAASFNGHATKIGLQAGVLNEENTFLGSASRGAFNTETGTNTFFSGVAAEQALGDTARVFGIYNMGLSTPKAAENSIFNQLSGIWSESMSVGVVKDKLFGSDKVGMVLSQPLRVMSGSASYRTAYAQDASGAILFRDESIDLSPSARELDIEAFYGYDFTEESQLTAGAMYRVNPGHSAQNEDEALLMFNFKHQY